MTDEAANYAGQTLRRLLGEGVQLELPTATTTHWDPTEGPSPPPTPDDPSLILYGIVSSSVLILSCVVTLAFNAVILASASWIRRPMSPTLSLSISLAAADACNALFLGTGLVVNSLLPRAFGLSVEKLPHGTCVLLGFEALRLGGVLVSVAHLLALAINHYLGILRPLHYAATFTPRITSILTAALWVVPVTFFFVYFSSIAGQGFQSPECDYYFLKSLGFRAVFSCLFFAPLVLMAVIYLHIYCIVRRTQCSRQRSLLGRQLDEGSRGLVRGSGGDSGRSRAAESCRGRTPRARQLARNWKAVVTTMLILGTYLLGWIPAVLLFLIVCDDCPVTFDMNDRRVMLIIFSLANLLIILKSLSNPIIYAARMQEIKAALGRMRETVLGIPAGPAASAADSTQGYGSRARRARDGSGPCGCCRPSQDPDQGFYCGEAMSRNRLSTYTSTASGGVPMTSNFGVSFRVRSVQRHAINGRAEATEQELLAEVVHVVKCAQEDDEEEVIAGHRVTVI